MINKSFEFKIGVIGLGYVGTPLACLFSKKYDTWGYDIKAEKVAKLAKSTMTDNKIVCKALEQGLKLTSSIADLKKCNVYIIAVPTPVNKSNKPDISCVRNATAEVGKILKEGDIVVDVVPSLLSTAREVNEQMAVWMAGKIKNASESRKFKALETNVLILGFSFKPDSDDLRNTKVADLYINLVGAGYKTTLYNPLVDTEEVKKEYNIKVTNDPKVLEKEYQIVVIGTHHKVFDNIDMNKIITDKGFMCDIYGIHKPRN